MDNNNIMKLDSWSDDVGLIRYKDYNDNIVFIKKYNKFSCKTQAIKTLSYLQTKYGVKIKSIEYLTLDSLSDVEIAELYFIHKIKPALNIQNRSMQNNYMINTKFNLSSNELDLLDWNGLNIDEFNQNAETNNYLYLFYNNENEIIYIGKTSKGIQKRLANHRHLPKQCYNEVNKIVCATLKTEADLAIYELYYINKYKPKYNTAIKYDSEINISLPELQFVLYNEIS